MKFSSAVTLTTAISIMSAVQGAPILPVEDSDATPPTIHYRRHSSISELAGRTFQGHDIMENLNVAFEPENGVKHLFNYVKRQLGGSAGGSTSAMSSGSGSESGSGSGSGTSGTSPADTQQTGTAEQDTRVTDGGRGLMGGGLSSAEEAGFAYEPGQGIRAA